MGTVISTAWLTFPSTFGDQNPIISEMLFIYPVRSQRFFFFFKLIDWRHQTQTVGRLNFKVKRWSWWQVGEKEGPAAINVCEVLVEEVMCFPARTQHIHGAVYWRALNLEKASLMEPDLRASQGPPDPPFHSSAEERTLRPPWGVTTRATTFTPGTKQRLADQGVCVKWGSSLVASSSTADSSPEPGWQRQRGDIFGEFWPAAQCFKPTAQLV